tara:strand:+ start:334 stop:633 length:300 start_codon:yes stop_codon:yes gene_type:complete
MLFSIISEDVNNSLPIRKKEREKHLKRLKKLAKEGRLIIAGPSPAVESENPGDRGFTGSIVIAEFDTLKNANEWANSDPYMTGGVYAKVVVKPFKKVLP